MSAIQALIEVEAGESQVKGHLGLHSEGHKETLSQEKKKNQDAESQI